jgi:predicted CopG family antitoxin
MKTKLTLSIDNAVLAKAKKAAKKEKKSLSDLFEQYLKRKYVDSIKKSTPITDSLTGVLKGKIPDVSYKELRDLMYRDKYGI